MVRPDRTLSSPNSHFYARDIDFALKTLLDLRWAGLLQEELYSLLQIMLTLLDRIPLACNVQLRAQGNIAVPIALYDCGQAARRCNHAFLQRFSRVKMTISPAADS